ASTKAVNRITFFIPFLFYIYINIPMEFFISFSLFMHGIIPGRKQSLLEEESIFGCKVRKKK
uniref:hypothetical protein n=1 Tax=Segatella hominis TaxID=2518605 RepID=UPI0040388AFB